MIIFSLVWYLNSLFFFTQYFYEEVAIFISNIQCTYIMVYGVFGQNGGVFTFVTLYASSHFASVEKLPVTGLYILRQNLSPEELDFKILVFFDLYLTISYPMLSFNQKTNIFNGIDIWPLSLPANCSYAIYMLASRHVQTLGVGKLLH